MRTITTVTTPPSATDLTTLTRVKLELDISGSGSDDILEAKIAEASSDIEAHLYRVLCRAGLTQRFWGEPGCAEYLVLGRHPVVTIASVTVDDVVISASEYRIDLDTGILYRLDAGGYPSSWFWCKDVVVVFTAGYLMPELTGHNLPAVLEAAAVDLVSSYWMSRGRDPLVKAEDIPGLGSTEYWVGAVGEAGQLPPGVVSKIVRFRRPQ